MLVQIFIPCFFAEEVITESVSIINSCYESMWYECNVSTRKFFFIIMERAKRPVTLKAGPFFTLSLNTFVMICKSSYSYCAVLFNLSEVE
ncbi:hypothetical protein Trydic_g18205 [Trypoxylus dichotomus]